MTYSKSPSNVLKMRPYLVQMVGAKVSLYWNTLNGHTFAYELRQAMSIAKKRNIKPFSDLKDKFVIHNKGNKVIAEPKDLDMLAALKKARRQNG